MTNTLLHEGFKYQINSLAYDPGRNILSGGLSDGTIRTWDLNTGSCDIIARHSSEILSIAYDPRHPVLAAGSSEGVLLLLDLEKNRSDLLTGHAGKVVSVAYDPMRDELASGSYDGTIRIWNLKNGTPRVLERNTIKGEGTSYVPAMDCVIYSRTGELACCSRDGAIHVWNKDRNEHRVLRNYWAESIAFDEPRSRLFVGTLDGRIYIIDIKTGKEAPLGVFKKHALPTIITHDTRRERIAIIENEGIYIWNLESGATQLFKCVTSGIMAMAFAPTIDQLAIGYQDGTICIGDISANAEVQCFKVATSDKSAT